MNTSMSVSTSFNVSRWRALALAAALAMGAGAPGLNRVFDGLADFIERHFEPGVLDRLIRPPELPDTPP